MKELKHCIAIRGGQGLKPIRHSLNQVLSLWSEVQYNNSNKRFSSSKSYIFEGLVNPEFACQKHWFWLHLWNNIPPDTTCLLAIVKNRNGLIEEGMLIPDVCLVTGIQTDWRFMLNNLNNRGRTKAHTIMPLAQLFVSLLCSCFVNILNRCTILYFEPSIVMIGLVVIRKIYVWKRPQAVSLSIRVTLNLQILAWDV